MLINRGMEGKGVVRLYDGMLLGHGKGMMPFAAARMYLSITILGEAGQAGTDTMWRHLYVD